MNEKNKKEQYMRRKYPAVNNAYKHYKMLMQLSKSGSK